MTSDTVSTPSAARTRVPVRRERLVGLVVTVGAVALNTLQSQLHMMAGYAGAQGWRELPVYLGYGVFGYLTAYALGLVWAHRSRRVARAARVSAVVLAVLGVVFSLFYFSALPMQYGAAVLLLVGRARRHSAPARLDGVLRAVGWLVAVAPYVFAWARVIDSALH